jgi:hypothetical protein
MYQSMATAALKSGANGHWRHRWKFVAPPQTRQL